MSCCGCCGGGHQGGQIVCMPGKSYGIMASSGSSSCCGSCCGGSSSGGGCCGGGGSCGSCCGGGSSKPRIICVRPMGYGYMPMMQSAQYAQSSPKKRCCC